MHLTYSRSRLGVRFWRSLLRDSVSMAYGAEVEICSDGSFVSTENEGLTSTGRREVFDDSYVAFLLCISCSVLSRAGPCLQECALFQDFRSRFHLLRRVEFPQSLLWDRLWSLLPRVVQRLRSCGSVSGESA